jgi:hypothetical protein
MAFDGDKWGRQISYWATITFKFKYMDPYGSSQE